MENASPISSTTAGTGRKSTVRMMMMPTARPMSLPVRNPPLMKGLAAACCTSVSCLRRELSLRSLREGYVLEPLLDARICEQREGIDLRADEGRGQGQNDEDDDDLRHEGQGHFLNLGQRLEKRDADACQHGGKHRRAACHKHGPDRGIDDIERVGLVHRIMS